MNSITKQTLNDAVEQHQSDRCPTEKLFELRRCLAPSPSMTTRRDSGPSFLASILPYTNAGWEMLSIFLTFLVPKLPS